MDPLIDGFALVSNINNNDVINASSTSQIDEDIDSFILANLEANAFEIFDFSQLVASPLNDESSSSTSSLTPTPKTSSPNELFDEFDPTSLKPISFTLPEIETDDGVKIRNEIILNFEPTSTQTAPTTNDVVQTTPNFTLNNEVLEAAENDLDIKIDEIDLINELIRSSSSAISPSTSSSEMTTSLNETRIELNDETTRSDDDEDMDDDDIEDEEVSNQRNKKNKRGEVVLTEEEISVYTKEGFKIPTRWPLTKSEEKTLKLVKRKIRNKKSAHVSRERKKKYIDGLEKRVDMCTKENENLLSQVKSLKNQNSDLMTKLNSMQTFLSRILNRNKKTSTAVLFISFFVTFCAYPMIDPLESDPATLYAIRNGFSRTLLAVPEEPSFFDGFGQFFSDSASNGFSYFSNLLS